MPRSKAVPRSDSDLRRRIACLAGRLMAEDGVGDYGIAKRKAARRLGVVEGESLPTNDEVEAELRAYQAIYQPDEQRARLRELRGLALEVMDVLEGFRPYLTGAVLDGTAGRYAEVEIDVFADSAETRRQWPDGSDTRLRLDWNGNPVLLSVFPADAERQRRRNPHTGRTPGRARAGAVAMMIEENSR